MSPQYIRAARILAYMSFEREVRTQEIIEKCLKDGKRVFLPRCNRENLSLDIGEIKDPTSDLEKNAFGIMEPKVMCCNETDPQQIDIVLVPGIAFDYQCNRIGFGAGYYDRFLSQLPDRVLKVGLAYEEQVMKSIPVEPHDIPLNMVITDKALYLRDT